MVEWLTRASANTQETNNDECSHQARTALRNISFEIFEMITLMAIKHFLCSQPHFELMNDPIATIASSNLHCFVFNLNCLESKTFISTENSFYVAHQSRLRSQHQRYTRENPSNRRASGTQRSFIDEGGLWLSIFRFFFFFRWKEWKTNEWKIWANEWTRIVFHMINGKPNNFQTTQWCCILTFIISEKILEWHIDYLSHYYIQTHTHSLPLYSTSISSKSLHTWNVSHVHSLEVNRWQSVWR